MKTKTPESIYEAALRTIVRAKDATPERLREIAAQALADATEARS